MAKKTTIGCEYCEWDTITGSKGTALIHAKDCKIVTQLREDTMSSYETQMLKRVEKTKALVSKFNKRYAGGTVYLVLNNEKDDALYCTFGIRFRFDDPFVDQDIYRSGSAYAYPSDALYLVLDVLADEDKIEWNNTRSTGWLKYPSREAK